MQIGNSNGKQSRLQESAIDRALAAFLSRVGSCHMKTDLAWPTAIDSKA